MVEDALGEPADNLEPLIVDVLQHELVHGQTVAAQMKTFDQLWRIRAAAADDRNLYPHSAASYARICGNC